MSQENSVYLTWQVPNFDKCLWKGKTKKYCVVIPVINEGERIKHLLQIMVSSHVSDNADIIIVDGGSTDGSLELAMLEKLQVSGLLVKKDIGKLSAQLRCAYAFALQQDYQGIITIDGNNKDNPDTISLFIDALDNGVDFAQASRFIDGGVQVNTPKMREVAIKLIHAPLLSFFSGFKWTDTTQGYRAYSRRFLMHDRVAPFRDVFQNYELLAYLSYIGPKLKFECKEIPTSRIYPDGEVPTKISGFKGNIELLKTLITACLGGFNP